MGALRAGGRNTCLRHSPPLRLEDGGREREEGERGIGCQKAPIANEMEEEDGEGATAKNERDSSVESAMLPARARQAPGRPKMQGLAI